MVEINMGFVFDFGNTHWFQVFEKNQNPKTNDFGYFENFKEWTKTLHF
jgi:hypothetical protein